jgi:hypothetical protein
MDSDPTPGRKLSRRDALRLLLAAASGGGARRLAAAGSATQPAPVFPGAHWEIREPGALGLDGSRLDGLAATLGGRGCVIKDGYMVTAWGDQAMRGDMLSSAKPVLSTLLFFAITEGKVESLHSRIADFGWDLLPKDRTMEFWHLADMTSGYARPEPPGAAFSYNDYAIQLYQKTLFDRVFRDLPEHVANDPRRLGALGLEDGLQFRPAKRRISVSVRDFARLAWFWLLRGNWRGEPVLPRSLFEKYQRPQVPADLPHTAKAATNDYLGIGTYGGDSDHFTDYGPGIYGCNWWFNATGGPNPTSQTWPDAPSDAFMSVGAGGNCSIMLPSQRLALVSLRGHWGGTKEIEAGSPWSPANQYIKMLVAAGGG